MSLPARHPRHGSKDHTCWKGTADQLHTLPSHDDETDRTGQREGPRGQASVRGGRFVPSPSHTHNFTLRLFPHGVCCAQTTSPNLQKHRTAGSQLKPELPENTAGSEEGADPGPEAGTCSRCPAPQSLLSSPVPGLRRRPRGSEGPGPSAVTQSCGPAQSPRPPAPACGSYRAEAGP